MKKIWLVRFTTLALVGLAFTLLGTSPRSFANGSFGGNNCASSIYTWTGATNNLFSIANNWDVNGSPAVYAPCTGSSLIFDNSILNSDATLNDDLNGVIYFNITFQGDSSNFGFDITSLNSYVFEFSGSLVDNSTSTYSDTLSLATAITTNQSFVVATNLTLDQNSTLSIGANALQLGGSGNFNVAGPIIGTGNITEAMAQSSIFSLTADSPSFTGNIQVTSGILSSASPSTNNNIGSTIGSGSGLIGDDGIVGDLNVETGGYVQPGKPSESCLTTNNLTLTGTYNVVLGGSSACTDYDQLDVSGAISLSSGSLSPSLAAGFVPQTGQQFVIIKNDAGSSVSGQLSFNGSSLGQGAILALSGSSGQQYNFTISYDANSENDVVLTDVTPVPPVKSILKSPDTGFGITTADFGYGLAYCLMAATSILIVAWRLKSARQ